MEDYFKLKRFIEAQNRFNSYDSALQEVKDGWKAEIYRKTIKSRKNANGNWEKYEGYEVDTSAFPCGHGEKSVIQLLRWGLYLTDDEILAIRIRTGGGLGHMPGLFLCRTAVIRRNILQVKQFE